MMRAAADEHAPGMRALFPRTRLVTIKGAGHWLHADQPEAVTETLALFLRSLRGVLTRCRRPGWSPWTAW